MLDVAVDDETVSGVGFEDFSGYVYADGSADDVDELVLLPSLCRSSGGRA